MFVCVNATALPFNFTVQAYVLPATFAVLYVWLTPVHAFDAPLTLGVGKALTVIAFVTLVVHCCAFTSRTVTLPAPVFIHCTLIEDVPAPLSTLPPVTLHV